MRKNKNKSVAQMAVLLAVLLGGLALDKSEGVVKDKDLLSVF